jgi:DNA-binding GntR family transcriptional regulator
MTEQHHTTPGSLWHEGLAEAARSRGELSSLDGRRAFYAHRKRRQNAAHRAYVLLRFAIKSGAIPRGETLEERDLMQRLGFSRAAIRDALTWLCHDRLVTRRSAVGTTVSADPLQVGFSDMMPQNSHRKISFRHTDRYEIEESDYLSMRLGRSPQRVIMTETDVYADGRKVGIHTAFSTSGGGSTVAGLGVVGAVRSRRETFPEEYGVDFGGADVSIDARIADERLAGILDIEVGEAVLVREEVLYDTDGQIWEYGYSQFRSDSVMFHSTS